MKKLIFIYFSLAMLVNAQDKILLEFQKWDLQSFKENRVFISKQEGIWLDNISEPEMYVYRAQGNSVTDKAMIICPGGGLFLVHMKRKVLNLQKNYP